MKAETQDTRQHILDTGYQLIAQQGFSNVGLSQLLKHADVPKGSFYHYFKSKEQFGEALIQDYFENYQIRLKARFEDSELSAYERLISYWQCWIDIQAQECSTQRCLVVKLTAEVADLSEVMRVALLDGVESVLGLIADCIEAGIKDGSIAKMDSYKAAEHLYNLWVGASLLCKLTQTQTGLQRVMKTTQAMLKNGMDES